MVRYSGGRGRALQSIELSISGEVELRIIGEDEGFLTVSARILV